MISLLSKNIAEKAIKDKSICKLARKGHNSIYEYYIPLEVNDRLLLAVEDKGFFTDGLHIISLKHVKDIVYNKNMKNYTKIFYENVEYNRKKLLDIRINGWTDVLTDIAKHSMYAMIETYSSKPRIYYGDINKVTNKEVYITEFDEMCEWNDTNTIIKKTEISKVSVYTRRLTTLTKYL